MSRLLAAAAVALAAIVCASCGPSEPPVRLRHEAKRKLVYELTQREEAPDPEIGLGGTLESASTVELACIAVEPDGAGHVEASVVHVKLSSPGETGVQVDTRAGRPVPGDRTAANNFAIRKIPRTALVVVARDASVHGIRSDPEVAGEVNEWMKGKPAVARKAIVRLAEALDAGPLAGRWLHSVAQILPPDAHAPAGAAWTASPPAVETPAGRLASSIGLKLSREGTVAVITGSGAFSLDGTPPEGRPIDFVAGTLEMTARIDTARGVIVSYDESGVFDFRPTGGERAPVSWRHRRSLRLVE